MGHLLTVLPFSHHVPSSALLNSTHCCPLVCRIFLLNSRTIQASLVPGDPQLSFIHFPLSSKQIKLASQRLTPSSLRQWKKAHLAFPFPVSFLRGKTWKKKFPDLFLGYLHNTVFMKNSIKAQSMSYGPSSLPECSRFIFSAGAKLNAFHKNQTT